MVPPVAPLRPAAALVLARPSGELWLARRSRGRPFMGNQWAFPGGKLEAADGALDDPASFARAGAREAAEELGLELDPSRLQPLLRLATPDCYPFRFDTVFLRADPGVQEPRVLAPEHEEGAWATPAGWIERWGEGRCVLSPPVLMILRALEEGGEALARLEAAHEGGQRAIPVAPGVDYLPLRTPTIPPARHTNCVLVGHDPLYVVDPGSPYPEEQARLLAELERRRGQGARPAAMLLTHHHHDHAGGVAALARATGLPLWAHPEAKHWLPAGLAVDRALADGEALPATGDGPRLVAQHASGHTADHLCLLEERSGVLLAGDLVSTLSSILVHPDDGHMGDYLRSLERMARLPLQQVLPAHGPADAHGPELLREQRAHRARREQQLRAALGQGPATAAQLVAPVYRGSIPESMHGYAELSLRSVLLELERRGEVVARDGRYSLEAPGRN